VTIPLYVLALNGGALVAAVVALWRQRERIRGLRATLDAKQAERQLPNRGTKFRIVYYTDTGVRARDHYANTRISGTDLVEFWHHDVLRDKK
jgi:hypothetical protein